ncbi:OmpA family protein [Nitrospira moscoviensis]|uniref:Putative Outer membrane protein, OmpA/MotB family n=1 Tax=Nitrospira moscoviensis TaxID=42253 RepID=A0A0K2G6R5_NITMO|nr:OmpA family protein [Nitrospira moscoviensis]ALA56638.1 putative Outer membrane protein, OmpA/MotB family [Nitrospira moscoviensis]
MKRITTSILAATLAGVAGCSTWDKTAICCDGGYEYRHRHQWDADKASAEMAARLAALERERQRLADELDAARKQTGALSGRVSDLERQLADRDRDLTALRSAAGDSARLAGQLSSAQGDLSRAQQHANDLEQQLASARQRNTDLEAQLAALSGAAGDKDRLAADLAATKQRNAELEAQLAAAHSEASGLLTASGERDRLAADLSAAEQRAASLEAQLAGLQGISGEKETLAMELAATKQRLAERERQLAERDKELSGLRGDLSAEMAKLKEAQRGLIKALRPQIDKGNIMVDLNNERLLINLASGYLFGSGEDQLKPAGAEALKQVGSILKDFPEYKVAVDGHTDNRPIRSELKKKFPSNKELSEARAANAALALTEGGLAAAEIHGYADTRPVMANTTDAGRAKNRRVEVRVTK